MNKVMIKMVMIIGVSLGIFGEHMKAEAAENKVKLDLGTDLTSESQLNADILGSGNSIGLDVNLNGSVHLSGYEGTAVDDSNAVQSSDVIKHSVSTKAKGMQEMNSSLNGLQINTQSHLNGSSEIEVDPKVASDDLCTENNLQVTSKADLSLAQKTKLWFMDLFQSIFADSSSEVTNSAEVELEASTPCDPESSSTKTTIEQQT
ncbi:hypothetical protein RZN25_03850 [Bacillaceae bacterium S4-13-56]